jgi:beta-xylosidase
MTIRFLFPLLGLVSSLSAFADGQTGKWGDQGDGTYRNPIIAGDYSDPDVIRVGSDYYMVTSTFEMSPGVAVLHSKDLVNWTTIGAAISDVSQLGPDFNWDRMNRYGEGVYAPSIRFHDGKFWVFVNCHSGEGFYQCTATNPAGPWTVTQIKDKNGRPLRTSGWTDPSPLWDDDGKAYLASSRPSGKWFGYLFQMTPDGTQLLDADVDKMNVSDVQYAYPDGGTLFSPFQSTEGNKLFKRNGYYYLQHIEFLDSGHGHGTYVMRSKNIYGTKADGTPGGPGDPGTYDISKFGDDLPGQGGFVDTPDGRWFWIGQFNQVDSDGRMPHLLPVTWIDDWPVPGVNIADKKGHFAWQLPKPIADQPLALPQGSDEFDGPTLNPQWAWNYQPRAGMWSLTERPGFLRLHAFKPLQAGNFFKVGDVINQRYFRSDSTVETIKLDLSGMADGQEAGLAHFNGGQNYATLGVVQANGTRSLKYSTTGADAVTTDLPPGTGSIWLRSSTTFDDHASWAYSTNGNDFTPCGSVYVLKPAGYRGDLIGIYTFNDTGEAGFVDVDFFHYDIQNK